MSAHSLNLLIAGVSVSWLSPPDIPRYFNQERQVLPGGDPCRGQLPARNAELGGVVRSVSFIEDYCIQRYAELVPLSSLLITPRCGILLVD
jgi:hypothetical protein